MIWLLRWLLMPVVVVATAIVLANAGWFDHVAVVVAFAIAAFAALFLWRRAALQLVPELWTSDISEQGRFDPALTRKLKRLVFATWGITITVMVMALLAMILLPNTGRAAPVALTVIFVASFSKFGVMSVFARRLLDHHKEIRDCSEDP